MKFDVEGTLGAMVTAAQGVIAGEWPRMQDCVQRALQKHKAAFEEIGRARISGEIDADAFQDQLSDEGKAFATSMLACSVLAKKVTEDAANAAIDAFNQALKVAVKIA